MADDVLHAVQSLVEQFQEQIVFLRARELERDIGFLLEGAVQQVRHSFILSPFSKKKLVVAFTTAATGRDLASEVH